MKNFKQLIFFFYVFRIDPNIDDIHNQADVNLNEILTQDVPRIEWNYLRRRYVEEDGCANLYSFLKKHRHLIIEVLMRTRRVCNIIIKLFFNCFH